MKWFREVLLDVAVTVIIILAVTLKISALKYIVFFYTVLMLLLKAIVFFDDSFLQLIKHRRSQAPIWFIHLLYGTNVLILGICGWWITSAQWAVIWLLSWLSQQKVMQKITAKGRTQR